MLIKIDMESPEFKAELQNTKNFADKVCESKGWVYNPIEDVNEGVIMGLARNKIIYNKRFCPCFMVIGETKEERKAADNRICPCKPAIEKEIPEDGHCHCGIFCTPEYAQENAIELEAEEVAHNHSRGLTKQECQAILKHEQLDSDEIQSLLEARELGMVEFNLVDVREWMEWKENRIKGTNYLIPTTSFYNQLNQIEEQKEKPTILYCLTGSRSAYCQQVLKDMGWSQVSNFKQGIVTYTGEIEKGES
jgi:ferredoxin-thioredoxin reductase catalytic subunit/rhodanese-related sulfurtransferase